MSSLKLSKAWKRFSEYIRKRDGGRCFTCEKLNHWKKQHAGHYIHRNANTFFDEMNVNCQCPGCNTFQHGKRGEYAVKLIDKYGREKFDDLVKRSIQHKYWSPKELKAIELKYMREVQTDEKPIKEKKRKICIHKGIVDVSCFMSSCGWKKPKKKGKYD